MSKNKKNKEAPEIIDEYAVIDKWWTDVPEKRVFLTIKVNDFKCTIRYDQQTNEFSIVENSVAKDDIDVVRVSGAMICNTCGKQYQDHPQDPENPWPTFVLLCDGTHAKT